MSYQVALTCMFVLEYCHVSSTVHIAVVDLFLSPVNKPPPVSRPPGAPSCQRHCVPVPRLPRAAPRQETPRD